MIENSHDTQSMTPDTPTITQDGHDYTVMVDPIQLDICVADHRWYDFGGVDTDIIHTVQHAMVLAYMNSHFTLPKQASQADISVLLTNDEDIQGLNRDYRNKDSATNVLSFALLDTMEEGIQPIVKDAPLMLGDVIVSYDTVLRESKQYQKIPMHHLTHLCIHGVLHLLGYDHIAPTDADIMETLETEVLQKLGISDPYQPIVD